MRLGSAFARTVVAGVIALACALPAQAANWDHAHILAPDPAEAARWYAKHFGGKAIKSGPFEAVVFGDILLKFRKSTPETKSNSGTCIDHIGFSVPDFDAKLNELKAAGVNVTQDPIAVPKGGFSYVYFEDPWGTRLELLDDKELLGFHHVHLRTPDQQATLQWFLDVFGGEQTLFKGAEAVPCIRYGSMWMFFGQQDPVDSSVGRSIDHIGFQFDDFDDAIKRLKDNKVEFLQEPSPAEKPAMAYILGPYGVKIEIVREPGAR